jgi:hypothetical protein
MAVSQVRPGMNFAWGMEEESGMQVFFHRLIGVFSIVAALVLVSACAEDRPALRGSLPMVPANGETPGLDGVPRANGTQVSQAPIVPILNSSQPVAASPSIVVTADTAIDPIPQQTVKADTTVRSSNQKVPVPVLRSRPVASGAQRVAVVSRSKDLTEENKVEVRFEPVAAWTSESAPVDQKLVVEEPIETPPPAAPESFDRSTEEKPESKEEGEAPASTGVAADPTDGEIMDATASARVRPDWENSHEDGAKWTRYAQERLHEAKDLLATVPTDIGDYCASYKDMDEEGRVGFWLAFLGGLSLVESSHNPLVKYREAFVDSTGKRVVSRGLLQISFESSRHYDCGATNVQQLHDPLWGLRCGVNIIHRLVTRDNVIRGRGVGRKSKQKWLGVSAYFGSVRKRKTLRRINNAIKKSRPCQPRELSPLTV